MVHAPTKARQVDYCTASGPQRQEHSPCFHHVLRSVVDDNNYILPTDVTSFEPLVTAAPRSPTDATKYCTRLLAAVCRTFEPRQHQPRRIHTTVRSESESMSEGGVSISGILITWISLLPSGPPAARVYYASHASFEPVLRESARPLACGLRSCVSLCEAVRT
ncbi:hypothetical protein K466DRAFT_286201 [Polyporus arcularius HHB13444]|uniref:Uncharacterized protein n=1 Tax=Polyporus arcularius HHB13444 TaxID=1314778 RepID=A0A5C3NZE8_9APHY|nr:hypothetical protein K466DRAFT_286201 [Polyporus arcularius HHB13444]